MSKGSHKQDGVEEEEEMHAKCMSSALHLCLLVEMTAGEQRSGSGRAVCVMMARPLFIVTCRPMNCGRCVVVGFECVY